MQKKKQSVFVGLSGGVDSSVSAALLKDAGYDVTGVFIKVWHPEFLSCPWKEDRHDAMKVCARLDIPFLTLDLEEAYKTEVVEYMVDEYKAGRTPNPDVMCNKHIKFGGFLDFARGHGIDRIATGHYAKHIEKNGISELHEGADPEKDQSYFLWTLSQEQLQRALFPVGGYKKSNVRTLASRYNLDTAAKKDSQGICFLGKVDLKEFLKHYIDESPGNVVNEAGDIVGQHDGAVFYTIGQRHGFLITEKNTNRMPYYVIAKDILQNTLTVSTHPSRSETNPATVYLTSENWVSGTPPKAGTYEARIRYRGARLPCTLSHDPLLVTFQKPQQGVSEGQSLVLYDDTRCVGGGIMTFSPGNNKRKSALV